MTVFIDSTHFVITAVGAAYYLTPILICPNVRPCRSFVERPESGFT